MRISDWSSDVCSSDLLTIPEARYKIIRQGAADVPELQGVRRKGAPPQQESAQGGVPSRFRLRINVKADNRIFVSGMGLESEWKSNVQVRGTTASPRLSGTLEVVRGPYPFASQRFEFDPGIRPEERWGGEGGV